MGVPSSLRVRSDTAELARVRQRVGAWAEAAHLPDRATRRLVLAVDEAVANAIEHGMDRGRHVMVSATVKRKELTVTVRYRGPRFDPLTAETPAADQVVRQRAAHGYGLHLIRSLADDAAYRWDDGTNEVRLTARAELGPARDRGGPG